MTEGRSISYSFAFYDSVSPAIVKHIRRATDDGRQSPAVPASRMLSCGRWRPGSSGAREQTTVWPGRGWERGIVGLRVVAVTAAVVVVRG